MRSTYALRTAIEERHRQYKCFWEIPRMHACRLALVVNQVLFVLLALFLSPRMTYEEGEAAMRKRELVVQQLERLPEQGLDRLLAFLMSLASVHAEAAVPAVAAEPSLAQDWLTPEEDAAWASL